MKSLILYGSSHGKTRKVVQEVVEQLVVKPTVLDVKDIKCLDDLSAYDLWLIFCPTYGDEELQDDMERFLCRLQLDLREKRFAVCELGNYYGYDDYSFGAMRIIRQVLFSLNASEFCSPLSLDSLPKINWTQLSRWIAHVNQSLPL